MLYLLAYSYRRNKGIKKVRFHETMAVREILQNGIKEENPSEERLFCKAMRAVNGDESGTCLILMRNMPYQGQFSQPS